MYRLDRFMRKKEPLKNTLPWARIVRDPAIVINKDGSLQSTFRYRGPDLDSAIKEHLSIITQQLNSLFMSIGTGWVLYFEAQRVASTDYPEGLSFVDPITKIMDDERKTFFSGKGTHFETAYYATVYWMPPNDNEGRLKEFVVEGKTRKGLNIEDYLENFSKVCDLLYNGFFTVQIPCEWLHPDEMLNYLHSTISPYNRRLVFPSRPALLDHYLYDASFSGGLEPRLGEKYLRIVSVIGYLQSTVFGVFDSLNYLNFPYRWTTRYYCLDKLDALDAVDHKAAEWKSKFKSIMDMIKEFMRGTESANANITMVGRYEEAMTCHAAIEGDLTSYGYYTSSVILWADTPEKADERAKMVAQTINNIGFRAKIEDLNAVDAWAGSLPGNVGRNVRRHLISCGNLVHMIPLSTVWAGESWNKHLNGPPLLFTQTSGNTPYRLNLHVGDVGHTLIVGPTGAGKSVLLNVIEASFRKYQDARIFIFDKGCSSYVLTHGVGGRFFDIGNESNRALSFQPLAHIEDERERQWALEWVLDFVQSQNLEITPDRKQAVWDALESVAEAFIGEDTHLRRMTTLMNAVQDDQVKKAIAPLCSGGPYGRIFDSDTDSLQLGSWQTFEMEKLMSTPQIVGTTLMYIFHRIEQSLNGAPTIIVLDECWVFFDNEQFAAKIREWLKVLRKANASVIFATQSITDIVNSPIFNTVLESCPSRIFLPNQDALEEETAKNYKTFGLNKRQIQILSTAIKKRDYYYVSPFGSRLFQLALENCPISLAYVAVNTKDVIEAKEIVAKYGQDNFNKRWLIRSGFMDEDEEKAG